MLVAQVGESSFLTERESPRSKKCLVEKLGKVFGREKDVKLANRDNPGRGAKFEKDARDFFNRGAWAV